MPGLSPLGNERMIAPLNPVKRHIVNKSAVPEDVRPKSPMGIANVGPLKKAVSNNEPIISRPTAQEKDKSPLGLKPKENLVQNQGRTLRKASSD